MERYEYDGIVWSRNPESSNYTHRNYYHKKIDGRRVSLHRYVYEKFNGEIPAGNVIHHKDGDHSNNDIGNLECLRPEEHAGRHMPKGKRLPPKQKTGKCEQCGEPYQHVTVPSRFCSNKCRCAWRRASHVDDEQRTCSECGGVFTCCKYEPSTTCSRPCVNKKAWRTRKGL